MICPACDKEMEINFILIYKYYRCNKCDLTYHEMTYSLYQKNSTVHSGTFKECCRVYKLKAFK